jgi:hypothetical protein
MRKIRNKKVRRIARKIGRLIGLLICSIPVIMFFGGMYFAGAAIDAEVTNYAVLIPSAFSILVGGGLMLYFVNYCNCEYDYE